MFYSQSIARDDVLPHVEKEPLAILRGLDCRDRVGISSDEPLVRTLVEVFHLLLKIVLLQDIDDPELLMRVVNAKMLLRRDRR